jgi:class 3 adenylate cyclase
MDIGGWLRGLGLEQYEAAFRDNNVDETVLPSLTAEDLKELGVGSVGHRRKLLDAIAALRAQASAPTPLSEVPPVADQTAKDTAERRQVTVMFSDLVGSTALSTRMDPEDLREVISAYQRCVAETVGRFGGFVAKYMGDGVLIYFGYPAAHEDDAERAVRAGLALIDAVAALPTPEPLQLRIGAATGMVVVGDLVGSGEAQERGIVGETPNLAARLQGIAEPNKVVIAEATRRLLGNLFELQDLGPRELKGIAGPVRAFAVLRASSVEGRFEAMHVGGLTALVGREEELELLLRRWARAKTGEGQVVLLSGEAGIGKSRLSAAIIEALAAEPHTRLRYFCSPQHTDSAFYPLVGQFARAAGFAHDDTPQTKLDKLDTLLAQTSTSPQDAALLADLLSLPNDGRYPAMDDLAPEQRRQRTLAALGAQVETLARTSPVLMILEDAHWSDPTSLEVFGRTVDQIASLRVLLIVTFRPEFEAPWVGQPHVTALALNRLGHRNVAALIDRVVGNKPLSANIRQDIIERTDGIPLFVEEMTKAVLEAGGELEAMQTAAAVPSPARAVPASLHASLMARLDRIGPAKEVAQIGAALGREFSHALLAAVAHKPETELGSSLDRLVRAGLLFRKGVTPHATYLFKHALVQEAAYGTLLRGPRQVLHARIAKAVREQFPEMIERSPEILAHHLTAAGELDSAATYWLEAGRRASGRSANIEAGTHFARGIAGLSGLTETPERLQQELALQLALGPVLLSSRGFGAPEAKRPYRRAAELAARLGDDRARFAASWGLWITSEGSGQQERLEEHLRHLGDLVQIADRVADPELSLQAHHSAWATWIWSGEFIRGQDHVRQGIALYDPDKHRHHALLYGGHDPGVCGKGQCAVALWALGYPDRGAQSAQEGIVLAERLRHVPSVLHSLWFTAAVCHLRQDVATVRACSDRLLTLGREHGLKQYQVIGGIFHGWALTQSASGEEGLAELRSCVGFYREIGSTMVGLFRTMLAEAELRAGNFEQAEALVATEEMDKRGWWVAEFLRLRGEFHRNGPVGDRAAAEQSFREALAVAQGQQAKSLELRAATSLVRLWRDEGRREEGHALLAPVYAWFTEGFDTLDLKQAKALLDELA